MKKKYALVGCGGRAYSMFAEPLVTRHAGSSELVGLCDINPGRMEVYQKGLGRKIPTFTDFEKMMTTVKPDRVLVATKDALHHTFILKALRHHVDVITEKPMTTDAEKCLEILREEKKSGRNVTVTFNMRFVPYLARIKEFLSKKVIGKILSVDFQYQLDRRHGADYFRRWHRRKENSGGLLIHKSTHHFDVVNWFLDAEPAEVYSTGALQFYGPQRAERGMNCRNCQHTKSCEFYFDINSQTEHGFSVNNKTLYAEVEHHDGYLRDGCVFSDEIDIEDTMHVLVRYKNNVRMSYSLIAHSPYEGWRLALNGTEGRLEAEEWHTGPFVRKDEKDIRIHRPGKTMEVISVPTASGGHGGGDERLRSMLFGEGGADPLGQMAGSRAGAHSLLIGASANTSMRTGLSVKIPVI